MTSDSPYVTRDELAARLAELELRIEQRMSDHFRNQTRMLINMMWAIAGLYAAVGIAAFVIAVKG